jgi:hypothetical protein
MSEEMRTQIIGLIKELEYKLERIYETVRHEEDWERICSCFEEADVLAAGLLDHNIALRAGGLQDRWSHLSIAVNS